MTEPIDRNLDIISGTTAPQDGTSNRYYVEDFLSLTAAVSTIGSTEAILVIDQATTITSNTTVPNNISILCYKTGIISPDGGAYTLAINGSFSAGLFQTFSGFGNTDVTFGSGAVPAVYPEWFGAVGDWDGSTGTDDTTAIQTAINSFKTIVFQRRAYKVTAQINLNPTTVGGNGGWHITGVGIANSITTGTYIYQATASTITFKFGDTSGLVYDQQSYIADIGFTGVSTATGIKLGITEDTVIERCKFSALTRGIELATDANCQVIKPRIRDCRFQSLDYGIIGVSTRTADFWIENNTFVNNRTLDISNSGSTDGGFLKNNFFGQDNTAVTTTSSCVYFQAPVWVRMSGNQFFNTALNGVEFTSPRNCTITENVFYRTAQQNRGKSGLLFSSNLTGILGFGNVISKNIFYETYGVGLMINTKVDTNVKIVDNFFIGVGKGLTGGDRIYDAMIVNDLDHATITGNYIEGKEPGLYVVVTTASGDTAATLVSQTGGTLADGMAITGKAIQRNTTVTVSGSDITLSKAALATVTSQNMTAGNIVTRYGLAIFQASNSTIADNISNNCVNRINFYSSNTRNFLARNLEPVSYSDTTTVNSDDEVIYVSAGAGWTLTLISAVTFLNKEFLIIKTDDNANLITVAGGGVNIDGAATYTGLTGQFKYLKVKSDGTIWRIIGSN